MYANLDREQDEAERIMFQQPSREGRMIKHAQAACAMQAPNNQYEIFQNIEISVHLNELEPTENRIDKYFIYFMTKRCMRDDPTTRLHQLLRDWLAGREERQFVTKSITDLYLDDCNRLP